MRLMTTGQGAPCVALCGLDEQKNTATEFRPKFRLFREFRPRTKFSFVRFVRVSSTPKKDETNSKKYNEINGIIYLYIVSSFHP